LSGDTIGWRPNERQRVYGLPPDVVLLKREAIRSACGVARPPLLTFNNPSSIAGY
jgi:hypothetical protein